MPLYGNPHLDTWARDLFDRATAQGHWIEIRRDRNGSTRWRLQGRKTEVDTFTACRRLERLLYGREYP